MVLQFLTAGFFFKGENKMGKKLYVGNISFQVTEEELTEHFSKIGEVASAKIITDMQSGQSKGFAFVEMVNEADAAKAIEELNGQTFLDRNIVVSEARPQKPRSERGYGENRSGGYDKRRGGPGGGGFKRGSGGQGRGRR